jgi:hypothetical protein
MPAMGMPADAASPADLPPALPASHAYSGAMRRRRIATPL